jgi:predicted nucleic acid-binding protein
MSANTAYLDTSAFVKLLVREPESAALRDRLTQWPIRASATILRTETVRALRRSGNDPLVGHARRLFATISLIRMDEPLLDRAADLDPRELRSLDSLHLAAAMSIGPDLAVILTYDDRLREAALFHGIDVESPA